MNHVKLQILAHPDKRQPADLQQLADSLRAHGASVTGIGSASIAAQITPKGFRKMFGIDPPAEPDAVTEAPAGFTEPEPLPVPHDCREWASHISIPPKASPM